MLGLSYSRSQWFSRKTKQECTEPWNPDRRVAEIIEEWRGQCCKHTLTADLGSGTTAWSKSVRIAHRSHLSIIPAGKHITRCVGEEWEESKALPGSLGSCGACSQGVPWGLFSLTPERTEGFPLERWKVQTSQSWSLDWAPPTSQALCELSIVNHFGKNWLDQWDVSSPAETRCAGSSTPGHPQHTEWAGIIRNEINSSIYPAPWKRCKSTDIAVFQNLEVS